MSLDLYRIAKGLQIESEDFLTNVDILFGTGVPGGDGGDQDTASIGSLYLRTDAGTNNHQIFQKFTTGSPGSTADWNVLASEDFVNAAVTGISWREPVRVKDGTAYASVAAAATAYNAGSPHFIVDGVEVVDGDRILLTNSAGSPVGSPHVVPNVQIVTISGSPLVLTLTEAANAATEGDAVLVLEGTFAETKWVFNGQLGAGEWIQFSAAGDQAELGFIRDFIGKAAGAETPTYSSALVVSQSNDLEGAIGELDAVLDPVRDQQLILTTTNVTAQTAVDSLAVAVAEWAKWLVTVEEVSPGSPILGSGNRRSLEIDAITDGTNVDHNDFARLKLGSAIVGLDVTVALVGSPNATLEILVTSTPGVDVTVKRLGFGTFN